MYKKVAHKIYHWTIPYEGNQYKPHAVRHKTLATYSALLIGVKVFVLLLLFLSYPNPAEFSTITINHIVELTNQAREEQGLAPLNHSQLLDLSAQKKAEDMLKNDYFAHTSPQDVKPWYWFKLVSYNYTYAGENLAMNFVEAEDAISAWMDSPTHRDNIISENYSDIGVAVMVGVLEGRQTTLVVQHFGKTHYNVAGETFAPSSPPIESESVAGPLETTQEAAQQAVKLESKKSSSWTAHLLNFSEKFFFVLLGFVILNLIITIIVRVEIQHKPIILHCFLVILLALVMIFMNTHFMEGLGNVVSII